VCGKKMDIVLMCAVLPVVHTSKLSSCQKNFFSFPVAVNNSIKVGPLVFWLEIFVITENIIKHPVQHTIMKRPVQRKCKRLLNGYLSCNAFCWNCSPDVGVRPRKGP
jgi:hypothetical protein